MKKRRGRPPKEGEVVVFNFKWLLRRGEDDDLIALLDPVPPRLRAATVKAACRSGGLRLSTTTAGPDDEVVANALGEMMF